MVGSRKIADHKLDDNNATDRNNTGEVSSPFLSTAVVIRNIEEIGKFMDRVRFCSIN